MEADWRGGGGIDRLTGAICCIRRGAVPHQTCALQPFDVGCNQSFKSFLREGSDLKPFHVTDVLATWATGSDTSRSNQSPPLFLPQSPPQYSYAILAIYSYSTLQHPTHVATSPKSSPIPPPIHTTPTPFCNLRAHYTHTISHGSGHRARPQLDMGAFLLPVGVCPQYTASSTSLHILPS